MSTPLGFADTNSFIEWLESLRAFNSYGEPGAKPWGPAQKAAAFLRTLSQQAEWPSDADVSRACDVDLHERAECAHEGLFPRVRLNREMLAALQSVRPPASTHPDDLAVDAFAAAMKAKLAEARAKGRGGWQDKIDCPQQRLSDMLRTHVEKGDPRDVGNFCMMLHQRGEAILPAKPDAGVVTEEDVEIALTITQGPPEPPGSNSLTREFNRPKIRKALESYASRHARQVPDVSEQLVDAIRHRVGCEDGLDITPAQVRCVLKHERIIAAPPAPEKD